MRDRCILVTAAFLLIAGPAMAQAPQAPQPPAPGAASPFSGSADFGGVFTATDGDEARYQRYRDERDGVFSNLRVNRSGSRYLFDADASHIGYRNQKYNATYLGPKVTFGFQWVSLPLNFSYITRTPFTTNGTTLTLDDNIQRAVQGPTNAANDGTLVGVPCAPGAPPAACSTPRKRRKRRRRRPAITRWRTPSICATAATPRSSG